MTNFDEIVMFANAAVLDEIEIAVEQPCRKMRKRENAFNLSDKQFINLFRSLARNIIEMVSEYIQRASRTSALSVETKVLIALRFFGCGGYQQDMGCNLFTAVSQSSVSRSISEVVNALNQPEIFSKWVKFPQNIRELQTVRNEFYKTFGFPGVIGCIDCTHVAIIAPTSNNVNYPENIYVNRKNYHSINVQLICDSRMKILNVNARFPGSTNDVYIWNNSNIKNVLIELQTQQPDGFYLLGDSGYPLRSWLLTPLEENQLPNTPEAAYNQCHKTTRCIIERCNGLLKMRFRFLLKHRVLHYAPEMASKIINACVVLHNMCIGYNVPDPENIENINEIDLGLLVNDRDYDENVEARRVNPDLASARRFQRRLIRNYFLGDNDIYFFSCLKL